MLANKSCMYMVNMRPLQEVSALNDMPSDKYEG